MRRVTPLLLAAVLLLTAALAGCADPDSSAATSGGSSPVAGARLIVLTMTDYKFEPDKLTAKAGETVTLRFINKGTVRHEAVIGDQTVQDAHAAMMASMTTTTVVPRVTEPAIGGAMIDVGSLAGRTSRRHPGMNAPNVISVEAGATGEVTYSLAKKAHLIIGCHEVGHYEKGMYATLDVV